MPDFLAYEVVGALSHDGCPVCLALEIEERRWLDTFRREAKDDPKVIEQFLASGGFCRRHAWQLHDRAAQTQTLRGLERVVLTLAERDLARISQLDLGRRRRRRHHLLQRTAACLACRHVEEATARKVGLLLEALDERPVWDRYVRSGGLCYAHLAVAVEAAADASSPLATALLEDWQGRLQAARQESGPVPALTRLYAGARPFRPE
jgi:hypothetical protein